MERSDMPLSGVRVLDLTHVVAGPYASLYLAMMGAEIVKIENPGPGGDGNRRTGPFVNEFSARFATLNHNKKSVCIDLSREEGRSLFLKMAEKADIVLENFRPGVLDKLGLGYEELRKINPRIVLGSISGFGSYGPYRDLPAYDIVAQAMSGIMWLDGNEGDPPLKVGTSIADMIAGINLVAGVLAGLFAARQSGVGCRLEVSLVDALISSLSMDHIEFLVGGQRPRRLGNNYREWCPCGAYPAKDGYYVLGIGSNEFFRKLACQVLEMPALVDDQRFSSHAGRVAFRSVLDEILTDWGRTRSVQEICERLRAAGIPGAPVCSIQDIVDDPHISEARDMFPSLEQEHAGMIRVTNTPIRFLDRQAAELIKAPDLGEQTDQILQELAGLDESGLADLRSKRIIL